MPLTAALRHSATLIAGLAALLVRSAPLAGQSGTPRALHLAAPVVSWSEEFTHVLGVVELSDGRVLVADDREGRLVVLAPDDGQATEIGRRGSGPAEFQSIGHLLPRPGGGAYLSDFVLSRLLPISADGGFENPIPVPTALMIQDIDGRGRVYATRFAARAGRARQDSLWIVRLDPATSRLDTLVKFNAGVTMSTGRIGEPFQVAASIDTWQVLDDGDLLIFGAKDYQVTRFRSADAVASALLPWRPFSFTIADQEAARREIGRPQRLGGGSGGASGGGASSAMPEIELSFPRFFPPFGGGGLDGRYTRRAPGGHVWVERMQPVGAREVAYDLIGLRDLVLVAQVRLPSGSRVVGMGRNAVFVAVEDSDGIERVRSHLYPHPGGQ